MHFPRLTAWLVLGAAGGTALAQTPAGTGPPAPTLAQALGGAASPGDGIVLAVGAGTVRLPVGAMPAGGRATAAPVAAAYGEAFRAFGAVRAVAPATMTVLNDDPINPNPYDGLGPGDAMKLLAASLTDGQWRALTGDAGLGLGDLSSDTQRQLFLRLLPEPLLLSPLPVRGQEPPAAGETRDVTAERTAARLRLRRNNVLFLPLTGENTYMPAAQFDAPGGARHFRMRIDSFFGHAAEVAGVPVRADVPNAPKASQLDFDAPPLRASVPLAGLKTVGDLVFRVGGLTHIELYPDARYETRPLTLLGHAPTAPAADLLRAVAFCVTGTFRRVGDAYVLTDDVAGAGARREVWREFEDDAQAARQAALDAAGDKLAAAHAVRDLAPVPGTPPLNAEEQKLADAAFAGDGFPSAEVPLAGLSPAQREQAQGTPGASENGTPVPPDFKRPVLLNVMPQLELLLPSIPDPIDYNASSLFMDLFQTAEQRRNEQPPDFIPRITEMPGQGTEPLADVLKRIPRRAAWASPSDAAALKDLLALMRQSGLNELWLPVPVGSDGLLPDALRDAAGTGIRVFPVLDVFSWPDKTPLPLQDLTLLGETSAQAAARRRRRAAQQAALAGDPAPAEAAPPGVIVSPFSDDVRRTLTDRVRALSAMPGVAGLVWRGVAPPGYDAPKLRALEDQSLLLGDTPAARLLFLREAHADPLDLFPDVGQGRADTGLPEFDDAGLEAALVARWRQRRADQDMAVLRVLRASLPADAQAALLVQEQGPGADWDWFGSWDRPDAPLPAFVRADGRSAHEQARAQSRTTLVRLPFPGVLTPDNLAARWRGALQAIADKKPWDGFVLDMTRD